MNNLLSFTDTNKQSTTQLYEVQCHCSLLRANQEDAEVNKLFAENNIVLPQPTQTLQIQNKGVEITCIGISADESWWLTTHNETALNHDLAELQQLLDQHHNQHNDENKRTLALIEQSAAYRYFVLEGSQDNATELLTHLIPYDWYHLQSQLESLAQQAPTQGKVISTIMQSVPVIIISSEPHHYQLLIRRSFADYAIHLLQHTANLMS